MNLHNPLIRAQSTVDFPFGGHVNVLSDYKETGPEKKNTFRHKSIPQALLKCMHVYYPSILRDSSGCSGCSGHAPFPDCQLSLALPSEREREREREKERERKRERKIERERERERWGEREREREKERDGERERKRERHRERERER